VRTFLMKQINGSFAPACEVSEKLAKKVAPGELIEVDWASRKTRSVKWHRRYWGLLSIIQANSERFRSADDVHMWLKMQTGLYDAVIELSDGNKAYMVRSVAFDVMTADEWTAWWPKAIDVVSREILPGIPLPSVEQEIERAAGLAA